jgi:hypothetical protein
MSIAEALRPMNRCLGMIASRLLPALMFASSSAAIACAPSAASAKDHVTQVTGGAPATPAHLDGNVLVTARGQRFAAPPSHKWIAVQGDVALLAPPQDDPSYRCELRDARTNASRGFVTTDDTAAGGSNVVCAGLAADGAVVLFTNSRGTYAKNVKTGASLPCGEGAFARDLTTCVTLDTSPFAFGGTDPKDDAVDFDVELCIVASAACKTLVKIPRGLNRSASTPRSWDAAYCSPSRVVVVANGRLSTFDAPTGRLIATAAAPGAVRVTCEGTSAKVIARDGHAEARSIPGT